jgi:hypothetical protein
MLPPQACSRFSAAWMARPSCGAQDLSLDLFIEGGSG